MHPNDFFPIRARLRMGARWVFPAGLALALFLGGCRGQNTADPGDHDETGAHLIAAGSRSGVSLDEASRKLSGVTTETASISDLSPTVQPTGEVAPTDSGTVQVTSRLPGKITAALVSVGARVSRPLARFLLPTFYVWFDRSEKQQPEPAE